MESNAAKVFEIPELREWILRQLPIGDLLAAQRVNRAFRDSVRRFRGIQNKRFFTTWMNSRSKKKLLNPFLGRLTRLCSGDLHPQLYLRRWTVGATTPEEFDISGFGQTWEMEEDQCVAMSVVPSEDSLFLRRQFVRKEGCENAPAANVPVTFHIRIWHSTMGRGLHIHYHQIHTKEMHHLMQVLHPSWVELVCFDSDSNRQQRAMAKYVAADFLESFTNELRWNPMKG